MRILPTAAAATFALLLLAGCVLGAPKSQPAPAATEPAPAATTPASAETQTPTPEPEEPQTLTVGDIVPADDIEEARADGEHIFVTGSGDGVVLRPGAPLPDPVLTEMVEAGWGQAPPQTLSGYGAALGEQTAVLRKLDDAEVPVIVVRVAGIFEGQDLVGRTYGATIVGVPDARSLNAMLTNGSRAEVDADVAGLLERYPKAQVVDLTE